jgi:predicted MPP superfamily phosphohydrolase
MAFGAVVFANADSADAKLQFNDDGNFRIMQIADIQDGFFLTPAVPEFIKDAVAMTNPDLIVLSGDNISGGSSGIGVSAIDKPVTKIAINNFMSVFEEIGIPVAVVFGNHDSENALSKEEQMEMYMSYDCCVAVDEGDALYGCGTYNLPVYSSTDANKIAYNLWMVDSNTYDEENGGYDHVHEDQIKWYKDTSDALKAQTEHLEEDPWVQLIDDYLHRTQRNRINVLCIWEEGFHQDGVQQKRSDVNRMLTILRNDIKGWHEVGKKRIDDYGRGAICFERDTKNVTEQLRTVSPSDIESTGFEPVGDTETIPF